MKMLNKTLISVTLLACIGVAQADGQIRFGTAAAAPPFEFVNSENQISGFDIDLANALCTELKAKCTFINQAFDSLIPALRFKRLDAVISSMDITTERKKQVAFSDPYYENAAQFVTLDGKYKNLEVLKGKKIGVQNGTTHQKYLQEHPQGLTLVAYDNFESAMLDLKNARVDAIFADSAVVQNWMKDNNHLTKVGDAITDKAFFGSGFGIALRQNDTVRLEQFNKALKTLKENGTYQQIHQKWF